jgi:hypothetical protein
MGFTIHNIDQFVNIRVSRSKYVTKKDQGKGRHYARKLLNSDLTCGKIQACKLD